MRCHTAEKAAPCAGLAAGAARAYLRAMSSDDTPVEIVRSARAKRLSLRWMPIDGRFRLTLPPRVSEAAGRRFLADQAEWMARQRRHRPAAAEPLPFAVGAVLPVFGVPHPVVQAATGRSARIEAGEIRVAGAPDLHAARIRRLLVAESEKGLRRLAEQKARAGGLAFRGLVVKEMRSRWGSCAIDGDLCFNWRLIFAPLQVADYVAAHEVAHLKEHNHSDRFWDLCFRLSDAPGFGRDWLKREGAGLFRYGAAP